MMERILYAVCLVVVVIFGLGAMACTPPPCFACGFTPGAQLVVTNDDNGQQSSAVANSQGCLQYVCGAHLTIVQIGGGPHVIRTPNES